mmetsp:Transcript_18291/g.69311  ORF Transcript_18291/g.69311 Transcript_18291/m.69311 type:complete len:566 (-) Transcript_18291:315-2012(-)
MQRLRVALTKKMKKSGGTPLSILRASFLHWDADASGQMNPFELVKACRTLGVALTLQEARSLIEYYDEEGDGEIRYTDLTEDLRKTTPSFLVHAAGTTPRLPPDEVPKAKEMPPLVQDFIRRMKALLLKKMRRDGGTEFSIVRQIFLKWDADQNGMLCAEELRGAARDFTLTLSRKEADVVVAYYTKEGSDGMHYQELLEDLTRGTKHYLHHVDGGEVRKELDSIRAQSTCRTESEVYFTARPKRKPRNVMVEALKVRLRRRLDQLIKEKGGTTYSHVREAFLTWDGDASGHLDAAELKGALNRLKLHVTDAETKATVEYYDTKGIGEITYDILINDMSRGAPSLTELERGGPSEWTTTLKELGSFTKPPKPTTAQAPPADQPFRGTKFKHPYAGDITIRIPSSVRAIMSRLQQAVQDATVEKNRRSKKSGAKPMQSRDYLHGTLLRYDTRGVGALSAADVLRAIRDMHITSIQESEVKRITQWFQQGDDKVPYEILLNEIWGKAPAVADPPDGSDHKASKGRSRGKPGRAPPSAGAFRKRQLLAEKARIEKRLMALERAAMFGS